MQTGEQDNFAAWVRARRAELKLTQEAVARRAKVSRPTLRRIEGGLPTHEASRQAVERALTTEALRRSLER